MIKLLVEIDATSSECGECVYQETNYCVLFKEILKTNKRSPSCLVAQKDQEAEHGAAYKKGQFAAMKDFR